jgi:hypothetical protein
VVVLKVVNHVVQCKMVWGGKRVNFCNVSCHVCSEMPKISNFPLCDKKVSDMSEMSTFFGSDNPRS